MAQRAGAVPARATGRMVTSPGAEPERAGTGPSPPSRLVRTATHADAGGRAAWGTIAHYVRGTIVVAVFHAVVISIVLTIIGVPLVAPLALIVGIGAFVPLVGAVVAGALSLEDGVRVICRRLRN